MTENNSLKFYNDSLKNIEDILLQDHGKYASNFYIFSGSRGMDKMNVALSISENIPKYQNIIYADDHQLQILEVEKSSFYNSNKVTTAPFGIVQLLTKQDNLENPSVTPDLIIMPIRYKEDYIAALKAVNQGIDVFGIVTANTVKNTYNQIQLMLSNLTKDVKEDISKQISYVFCISNKNKKLTIDTSRKRNANLSEHDDTLFLKTLEKTAEIENLKDQKHEESSNEFITDLIATLKEATANFATFGEGEEGLKEILQYDAFLNTTIAYLLKAPTAIIMNAFKYYSNFVKWWNTHSLEDRTKMAEQLSQEALQHISDHPEVDWAEDLSGENWKPREKNFIEFLAKLNQKFKTLETDSEI
ncbi:hypothetical protein [Pseudolactococcus insecticola]|uniref:Uncharacterized protein n=1 Tax=Pseudolactococcus insecticola TaxID=2709158 RepID=A0A6A0B7Z6_9LACT|nr:hypothetical protein [Lactococcus insecticola]GFH41412.1 hypothetical protein Hs20B_18100 [Lactococcus insecticola]